MDNDVKCGTTEDERFMRAAIEQAKLAGSAGDVPVGAVMVKDGEIISRGRNRRETFENPIAHAEMEAIEKAAEATGHWRLMGCTLYVTMEPCAMCAGAVINARIPRVVFGAYDKRFGAFGSLYSLNEGKLNHTPEILGGVLEEECASLLRDFFAARRGKRAAECVSGACPHRLIFLYA